MSLDPRKSDVLVIEDEPQIRRLLRYTLEDAGYAVRDAATAQLGINELARQPADAVVLDLGLPDLSGIEVLKTIRAWSAVPVLVLSVFAEEGSKINALDAGADDYVTKPFGGGELLARLRALLRRIKPAVASSQFSFGTVQVDFGRRRVVKAGQLIRLTRMEYALLQTFITHREKVLTHRQILRELWGAKAETQTHYLRTYMLRLRRKLEDDADTPRFFQTESGVGYRFVGDATD
jgi:two-component system KDP operon response regulator KdpE